MDYDTSSQLETLSRHRDCRSQISFLGAPCCFPATSRGVDGRGWPRDLVAGRGVDGAKCWFRTLCDYIDYPLVN